MKLRYKLSDYRNVRKYLHELMKEQKKKKGLEDNIAYIQFLKRLKRDIDTVLKNKGVL